MSVMTLYYHTIMKTDVTQEVTSDSCLFVFQSREIKLRDGDDKPFKIIACGKYKCNAGNKQKKLYCTISICMCVCVWGVNIWGGCMVRSNALWVMVTWEPPPHPRPLEQNDRAMTENITFRNFVGGREYPSMLRERRRYAVLIISKDTKLTNDWTE